MVFPGRLSTGCKLCRRRKVKCDEAKPSCNRCAIYGQPCPGYGDNFQFRPQEAKIKKAVSASLSRASDSNGGGTSWVKQRQDSSASRSSDSDNGSFPATVATQARDGFEEVVFKQELPVERIVPQRPVLNLKTWQPEHQFFVTPPPPQRQQQHEVVRQRHQQHKPQNQQSHRHRSQKQLQLARTQTQNLELNFASSYEQWLEPPLPSPPPTQCREQQSLCYFMNRFVARKVAAPFPGHLSFLYDLYDGSNMTSLEMATLSTAEMTAYNKFGIPELKQRAYRHRGAALRGLSAALSSPDRDVRFNDKTIGTVLLLGTFADISGEGSIRDGAHVTGLHYLLEQRGKGQLTSKIGAEIFFLGVMKLHIHAFVTNDYSYADPGGYSMLMQDVDPVWRARALVCKIPRLRSALSDHLHAMASTYQLETTSNHGSPISPVPREQSSSPPSDKSASPERIPPLQAEDVQQIVTLYMGCMKVLGELSEWDQDITRSPAFNPDIVEIGPSPTLLSPISPLAAEEPLRQQQQPRPNRYDSRTACTVIMLKSTRVMLLLSLLAYLKRVKDWVAAYPRLTVDTNASLLLAAMFSSASPSAPNVEKMLDDVRNSLGEIERCVPFAVGSERDDLDGIASFQEGSGMGHDSATMLSSNQVEVAAAALIIMHPLILVAMCPYSTPQQKQMSIDVLHRMDKNMGIRAARHRLRELTESEPRGLFF